MSTRSARGPPVASVPKAKDKHTAGTGRAPGDGEPVLKATFLTCGLYEIFYYDVNIR